MILIIYVTLLMLTPKFLSLPFDPQNNAFLSWAHSYAAFHKQSNCLVCGALSPHQWKASNGGHLPFKEILSPGLRIPLTTIICDASFYLKTYNSYKIDWCNMLHFNYGYNVTFNFAYTFSLFNENFATYKANRSRYNCFYLMFIKYGMRLYD